LLGFTLMHAARFYMQSTPLRTGTTAASVRTYWYQYVSLYSYCM
jgi:hypothetical protein